MTRQLKPWQDSWSNNFGVSSLLSSSHLLNYGCSCGIRTPYSHSNLVIKPQHFLFLLCCRLLGWETSTSFGSPSSKLSKSCWTIGSLVLGSVPSNLCPKRYRPSSINSVSNFEKTSNQISTLTCCFKIKKKPILAFFLLYFCQALNRYSAQI